MSPKKSFHRRPCSDRRTSRISSKFSNCSSQSGVNTLNLSRNRKLPEKLDCLRECRVMLNSDRDALQTEENSNIKPKKNVIKTEIDANLQNSVQRVQLLQNRVRLQTEYNLQKKNFILAMENNKIVKADIDVCNVEDDQLANRQEVRHIVSQPNKLSSDSNAEHGRINVNKDYTVERCVSVIHGKSIDLTTNENSPTVMVKLPGSNSYRQLNYVGSDTAQVNLVSAVEDGNRQERLPLSTPTVHRESILGIAVIEPKASNCNTTIDLEESSSESDILHSDGCDHKICKTEHHRSKKCLEKFEVINFKSDAPTVVSKTENLSDSGLQCTLHCEVQSGRNANDFVGYSVKRPYITLINNNDYDTLEKQEPSQCLNKKDDNIDDQKSKTFSLQDYFEAPFIGCKGGRIPTKGSSFSSPGEVGKAIKKVLCEQFDSRPFKSLKSLEKTKLADGIEISTGKTCSLPFSCTCPGCSFSPPRGTSVCEHTSGHCVVCAARSRSLNQRVVLTIDQSSTDVEKNVDSTWDNFALPIHINRGDLIQAKRKRACCHSSDAGTRERQKLQTSVHDRTRKRSNVYAKKAEPKNIEGLLSCRSCSFRAISETILEQHARMHEQLLSKGCTDTDISFDAQQTTMQTPRAKITDELMGTKRKRSISGVLVLTNAVQGQAQASLPVIVHTNNNNEVSKVQTPVVPANPSSPTVILKTSKNSSKGANTFGTAYPRLRDSKTCHDYSNALTTKPKYCCKYCGFGCIKQQKYANHMRFCPLSMKRKQYRRASRSSHRIGALLGSLEADSSPNQDKSNDDDKIISSSKKNLPTIIKEEPEFDAVSSQPANTAKSTSRDIQDLTTNLPTKTLAPITVPGAYREVLHQCSLCDFTTVVMDSLVRHGKHHRCQNDLDTLLCPMCAYETTDAAEMKQHFSQSGIHGSVYSEELVGMEGELHGVGELDFIKGELEIFHLCDTMKFGSEVAAPVVPTNADETEAIRTVEQIVANKLVNKSSIQIGPTKRLQNPPFPSPNTRSIFNNDAVALSSNNSFNANPFHRRLLKNKYGTSSMGKIKCSKPGCNFVTLHLKSLKIHERRKNHVYQKFF